MTTMAPQTPKSSSPILNLDVNEQKQWWQLEEVRTIPSLLVGVFTAVEFIFNITIIYLL